MILNFALLMLLAASKRLFKASWPYLGAALLGVIKFVLYLIGTRSALYASAAAVVFFILGFLILYFIGTLDKAEVKENSNAKDMYSRKKGSFKWQYIPLVACVCIVAFGENILVLLAF